MNHNQSQNLQVKCRICDQTYNDKNPPRYIGCAAMHCVCSRCIQQALESDNNQFVCPVDQQQIDITNKTLANFTYNRDILEAANEIEQRLINKCRLHQNSDLSIFCLPCKTRICYHCQRTDRHKAHKFDSIANIQAEINSGFPGLGALITNIDGFRDMKRRVLNQGKQDLLEALNYTLEYVYEVLRTKIEEVAEKIENTFTSAINQPEVLEETEIILAWKNETERLIVSIDEDGVDENNKYRIAADLYAQEDLFTQIGFSTWEEKIRDQEESLRLSLKSLSIDKNEMLIKAIENLPFCQFDPYNNLPSISNIGKFEFEQCVLKCKDPYSVRRVQKLFRPLEEYGVNIELQSELGVFEIKENFVLDDHLAQRIPSVIGDVQDHTIVETIQSKIREVRLRCSNLTNDGMTCLQSFLEGLEGLDTIIIDFQNCEATGIKCLKDLLISLRCYQKLQTLKLGLQGWKNLSSKDIASIAEVISAFPSLKIIYLDLSRCRKIGDKGVKAVFKSFSGIMELESFTLSLMNCVRVTDDLHSGLEKYVSKMETLETLTLDLRECPKVTDDKKEEIKLMLQSFLANLSVQVY